MANFTMKNWRIVDRVPYVTLGSAGENNASTISIQVDELIEGAEYYLDIGDDNGSGLPNTQQLIAHENIAPNGETVNILALSPMTSFLGKEGIKLLQVRCMCELDNKQIIKQSNVFHAKVDKNSGFVYKYSIAAFEQYIQQIKDLINNIDTSGNSGSGNSGEGGNTSTEPTIDIVDVDMKQLSSDKLTLLPNKYYRIVDSRNVDNSVARLEISLNTSSTNDYRFSFISGNTPTELILPNNIYVPSNLTIEANSYYDITINGKTKVMTYTKD